MQFFFMLIINLVYNFGSDADMKHWKIMNDGVMGGISQSQISVNAQGNGVFQGSVSLANNGGFASVHYRGGIQKIGQASRVILRLKGDGKKYQFRIKESLRDAHSYVYKFDTSGDWQDIEIPIKDMYAAFRGRRLNIPSFNGDGFEEMAFLISNKQEEDFQLEIAEIKFAE